MQQLNAQRLQLQFSTLPLEQSSFTIESSGERFKLLLTYGNQKDSSFADSNSIRSLLDFLKQYDYPVIPGEKNTALHISGRFSTPSTQHQFEFNRPVKGSKNHQFMELIFTLMYAHFGKSSTVTHLENLEQYFDFGMGIKILNEQPLIYKLYGKVTAHDASQFYAFLDAIPSDSAVQIDMSNFHSMGRLFYTRLNDFTAEKQNVSWINCSPQAIRQLHHAGVPTSRVLPPKN
jgi:hypothetical protein